MRPKRKKRGLLEEEREPSRLSESPGPAPRRDSQRCSGTTPAHRRYQRLFRRTILASPPLDSPMSLLNRFLRNSSNICIMCSRFPRPPPPHPLARSHTRRHTLPGLTQHPSSLLPPATRPGRAESRLSLAPGSSRLTHSSASSPGR